MKMAKKDKEKENEKVPEAETLAISKALIKELNKDAEVKVAWSLATDKDNPTDVKEFVDTGSTLLNYQIANRRGGGAPGGKIIEIVGEEATGKSLFATQILANAQKMGGIAAYIDEENALNPEFAKRLGLNLNELIYLQCGSVEAVGEHIEKVINLARTKDVKRNITIVWDSIAATPPKAELEGDYDPNSRIGLQAKAIAKMMRKLTNTVGRERVTLVFTNQMKVKIGVMYGDPMGTPGGKAVPYHASVRIRLTRVKEIKDLAEQTFAIKTRAKIIKNRLGPPLRSCEFDIHFANGIDDAGSIRDYLHSVGEIEKAMGKCYLTNIPSGEITKWRADKEDHEGDRGFKFEEEEFATIWADPTMKQKIYGLLDKHLIISYDAKNIPDQHIDPESYLDNEAVIAIAQGE